MKCYSKDLFKFVNLIFFNKVKSILKPVGRGFTGHMRDHWNIKFKMGLLVLIH